MTDSQGNILSPSEQEERKRRRKKRRGKKGKKGKNGKYIHEEDQKRKGRGRRKKKARNAKKRRKIKKHGDDSSEDDSEERRKYLANYKYKGKEGVQDDNITSYGYQPMIQVKPKQRPHSRRLRTEGRRKRKRTSTFIYENDMDALVTTHKICDILGKQWQKWKDKIAREQNKEFQRLVDEQAQKLKDKLIQADIDQNRIKNPFDDNMFGFFKDQFNENMLNAKPQNMTFQTADYFIGDNMEGDEADDINKRYGVRKGKLGRRQRKNKRHDRLGYLSANFKIENMKRMNAFAQSKGLMKMFRKNVEKQRYNQCSLDDYPGFYGELIALAALFKKRVPTKKQVRKQLMKSMQYLKPNKKEEKSTEVIKEDIVDLYKTTLKQIKMENVKGFAQILDHLKECLDNDDY